MWMISQSTKSIIIPDVTRLVLSLTLFALGFIVSLSGVASFRAKKATVNPLSPSESTSLVITGVYKFSRNPMYLGFLLVLVGWGVFLSNLYSSSLTVLFVYYMNTFQILPEESMLQEIFGEKFSDYKKQVRRWV
jgi:protein-S-isoprenylcysteine O-methyltransferase Ste14